MFVDFWRHYAVQEAGSLANPLGKTSMLKLRKQMNESGGVRLRRGKYRPRERNGAMTQATCQEHFARYKKYLEEHPLLQKEPGRILNMDESGRGNFAVA